MKTHIATSLNCYSIPRARLQKEHCTDDKIMIPFSTKPVFHVINLPEYRGRTWFPWQQMWPEMDLMSLMSLVGNINVTCVSL